MHWKNSGKSYGNIFITDNAALNSDEMFQALEIQSRKKYNAVGAKAHHEKKSAFKMQGATKKVLENAK